MTLVKELWNFLVTDLWDFWLALIIVVMVGFFSLLTLAIFSPVVPTLIDTY
jgi:hypothetical protein